MKYAFAFLFLLPVLTRAQDTCQLKKETDPFTHQTKVSTGFVPFVVNGQKLSISVDATNTEVDFFFWFQQDAKCFDESSTIQINYEGDRVKANFKNSGSMNCEGAFHFNFRNSAATPVQLDRLSTKRISTIKISGSNKSVTDISFTEDQKKLFMRMVACVVRESRTLPK